MEGLVHSKRMSTLCQAEVAVRVSKTLAQKCLLEGKVAKLAMLYLSLSCYVPVPVHLVPFQFLKLRRPLLPPYLVSKDTLFPLPTWCLCRSFLFLLVLLEKVEFLKKQLYQEKIWKTSKRKFKYINLCIYKG